MTTSTETTNNELHDLLQRIRDDPDAGAWAEWARRLMEGDAQRKRKAVEAAKRGATGAKGSKKRPRPLPPEQDCEHGEA